MTYFCRTPLIGYFKLILWNNVRCVELYITSKGKVWVDLVVKQVFLNFFFPEFKEMISNNEKLISDNNRLRKWK